MGVPFLDYIFTRDPIEFHFRLLVLNGFWPMKTKKKLTQVLCSIYSFICLFSTTSIFFSQVLDVYLLRNDHKRLTRNLCSSSATFASVCKQALIFYKIENIEKLHKELTAFKETTSDPEELRILEKADRRIWQATKTMYFLVTLCISVWMIYPALDSSSEKTVPYAYRLPVEYDWSPLFEIIYSYQSISLVSFMVMVVSNDMVYYGMAIQINAQYEILIKKLKALDEIVDDDLNNNDDENGEEIMRDESTVTKEASLIVKECLDYHQNILKQIKQLTIVYGKPYLVHLLAATVLVGAIIIDVIVVSKGIHFQLLQRVIYSLSGVFDTFLCCFYTTEMQERNFQLRRAVYSTPWYKLTPKIRKDLLMITMKTIKAPAVKVANIFPLNLSTFLQFLRISYNITALLYQTMNR